MKTIRVLGESDESLKDVSFGRELPNFTVSNAIKLTSDRAVGTYQQIEGLQEDDVVELIFNGGIHRWVTIAELEEEYRHEISRGADLEVIEIPSQLPATSTPQTTRGAAAWMLKGLRVLKYDPIEKAARGIAEVWDDKLMPQPGLYRFEDALLKQGNDLGTLAVDAEKPILLFLHGTFSSTQGSFGALSREIRMKLQRQYGGQIFGYDHRTLSRSPIQNALDLVDRLPENAVLHLVTHSRGGLIGELLTRSGRTDSSDPFDETDLKLAAAHLGAEGGESDLLRLSNLLKAKNIRVERFARIACPARGTTLASGRIDRWIELLVNVLSKVLEPATRTLLSVLTDLLLDLKKQAANPEAIPGLAAMVPESGFIRMINRPEVQVGDHLYVIAGDVEKNDVLGRLAIFFADLFYFEDHDLAVQTRAMYGGARRDGGLYFFHKGANVNHFHYFSGQRTSEKILEALTLPQASLPEKGFRVLEEAYEGKAVAAIDLLGRSFQKRANVPQPVVYVLPGIMGTHLSEGTKRIWLDLLALAGGKLLSLRLANRAVRPHSLVAMAYARLVDDLSATHEVIPFPYDWRLSILDEAQRFAGVLEAKLEETRETRQPIRIVAHSMGGLVTRAMIGLKPELWERIRDERKGSRLVMLGTPNRGAHQVLRLILGQEQTLRMLAMLDVRNPPLRLLEVITRFPGVLQLLPMSDDGWDFLDANAWNKFPGTGKFPWVKPLQEDLDEVKRFHAVLNSRTFTAEDPVVYVAGVGRGAPVGIDLSHHGEVIFKGTDEGDGTVTWSSGILPELEGRAWYTYAPHGDMANHPESFAAIYELLQEGKTMRLSKNRPQLTRGMTEPYVLPEEPPQIFPAQEELEQVVLGTRPIPLAEAPAPPVRVSVAHGNLAFCNDPVAVGHYEGDPIVSAEKHLDSHLDGKLSDRHRMGRYPGPEGTAAVVLNDPDQKPGGAIIVGLGKAGELSPRKLTQAFANAMREYGIVMAESNRLGEEAELAVTTLLIGAGGMGLSVANSIDAILNGVLQANKTFSQMEDRLQKVRIARVQFIELYKDQAILATRALRAYEDKPEFDVKPRRLRSLRGGFQRLYYEEPPGWWSRIYVRAGTDDSLIFMLPTDRARAEESQQGMQKDTIDGLVSQAVKNPRWDQDLASSMFELMIPNRLKGSFRDLNNILLVLDPDAAHYPWELIYDRRAGQDHPLVIQFGLIRQFSTGTFQERVVDVKNKNVVVVGNPDPANTGFKDLPGAEQEARRVAAKFGDFNYNVVTEIRTGSNSIMNSLFAQDYRVLHLAAHGVHRHLVRRPDNKPPKEYTGVVIGKDIFLTANEMKNKMDIPELVFINCCHLGTMERPAGYTQPEYNKLAASLARELIEMGVKAVIAAGWAVDDSAALTFADVFYDRLLTGAAFGDAVKAARVATYHLHKDRTNTWAAYQCYGDPTYRLIANRDEGTRTPDPFVDLDEAVMEIRRLSGRAKTASVEGISALQVDLLNLHQRIKDECDEWLSNSSLQEALGEAFGEVYLFDNAIEYYKLALDNQKCAASVKAFEQLANIRTRKAVQLFRSDPDRYYEESQEIINAQIKALKALMRTLCETSERWSLIGGAYKRLARITCSRSPETADLALQNMEKAYREAGGKEQADPYALANLLAARLLRLLRSSQPEELDNALPQLRTLAQKAIDLSRTEERKSPDDFWAGIGVFDASLIGYLVRYLESRELREDQFDVLAKGYKDTWQRYGSARELYSVIDQYAFLAAMLEGNGSHNELSTRLSALLGLLEEAVAK